MSLTKRIVLYCGFIYIFFAVVGSFQSSNARQTHTACYGNGHQSFIDANCSDTENIYPISLIAGAKPGSSGCPAEMEWDAPDALVQQCCVPDSDQDCQAPVNTFVPDGASNYLDTCVGRTMCRKRPAFRMDVLKITTCNSSIYPTQTHYLYLDYYCIPDSNIGRFPLVNETNDGAGSLIYLQGSEYPAMTSVTAMTCSLETDCFEIINIYGMHIHFEQDNVTCNQTMVLNDTSGTLYTISCADNDVSSGYRFRTLTTSEDNYMEIRYSSFTNNQGLFWLAFNASGNLTLNCPKEDPKTHCNRESPNTTPDSYMCIPEIVGGTLGSIIAFHLIMVGLVGLLYKLYTCIKQKAANRRSSNQSASTTTETSFNNQTDADKWSSNQPARITTDIFNDLPTRATGPANTNIPPRRLSPLHVTAENKITNKRKRKKGETKKVEKEKEYQQHDTTPPENTMTDGHE